MWSSASAICDVQSSTWRSEKCRRASRARRMWVNRSPSSAYAVTMHRDSVSSSRKDSLYAMMFGWRSFDRSCASASASPRCAILCTGIFFATYGRRSLRCITRWHVP